MQIELSLVVMAGVVLALFLIVGEIAALRKRARRTRARLRALYAARRYFRLTFELCVIAALVLIQPAIIGLLVALAMDGLNPDFSGHVLREIREAL